MVALPVTITAPPCWSLIYCKVAPLTSLNVYITSKYNAFKAYLWLSYAHCTFPSLSPFVAEIGDYEDELDAHHLENKQYVPNQEYLDHKIIRFHKKHR